MYVYLIDLCFFVGDCLSYNIYLFCLSTKYGKKQPRKESWHKTFLKFIIVIVPAMSSLHVFYFECESFIRCKALKRGRGLKEYIQLCFIDIILVLYLNTVFIVIIIMGFFFQRQTVNPSKPFSLP